MICNICGEVSIEIFKADILKKYNIKYYRCLNCGFLYTEKPYWLEEAYEESINITDTE